MIGRITGLVVEIVKHRLVLEVQSSIGYEVHTSALTLKGLPKLESSTPVTLHTHLLVTDSSHTLYGFITRYERDVFRGLLAVSGIGASRAIASLSQMSAYDLVAAIKAGDAKKITTLQGVGDAKARDLIKGFPTIEE